MCPNKASPNRKGLGHIANSLKEIIAQHVGNVPRGRESQKRNLQIDTEVSSITDRCGTWGYGSVVDLGVSG